jgi:BirA family biotin operon repressor/biotin-[acetyl-CoA-carboxylase] ligase
MIGKRLVFRRRVTSTNELAKTMARDGTPEGTVVIALEQTAGKGRMKRQWLTPPGNVAVSVVLYPTVEQLPSLIMLAALAMVRCISKVTGLSASIKWPNDVQIAGSKVSGILVETSVRGPSVYYAVIGIGVNVRLDPSAILQAAQAATSLETELGREASRLDIVRCLLSELETLYLDLKQCQSPYEEWRAHLVTLGKHVRVTSGAEVNEGTAEDVSPDGGLLVREADGRLHKIVAGDIATLRRS